jgi:hypothetical protein
MCTGIDTFGASSDDFVRLDITLSKKFADHLVGRLQDYADLK